MKSGFYGTKMKQQNPIKMDEVLFEYNIHHIWPKNGHNHSVTYSCLQVNGKNGFFTYAIFLLDYYVSPAF